MICAIVLAAGCSSRMGSQKLLLPFGSKTVITHIVDQILAAHIDQVYVVVGHQRKKIEWELSERPVYMVDNPNYESGMLSSVRCGLRAVDKKCQAVLVALGDQPSVTTTLVDQMVKSFGVDKKQILVPLYQDKRGHPILFSMIFKEEILTNFDDVGLRGLLQAHSDDIFEMSVSSPTVLSDMDCPEDYQRELARLEEQDRDKSEQGL